MIRLFLLSCMAALLAGCAPHPPAALGAAGDSAPASAASNALVGTPMAEYGHALNRAKNVQNVVNEQARKQAKAIEKATGGN